MAGLIGLLISFLVVPLRGSGLELEGKEPVEGRWVNRIVGLDDFESASPSSEPQAATAGWAAGGARRRDVYVDW